jgi:hypothetical protein
LAFAHEVPDIWAAYELPDMRLNAFCLAAATRSRIGLLSARRIWNPR